MKPGRIRLALVAAACLAGHAGAKPNIPQERISPETPPDVRRHIEELYSRDAVTRAYGAVALARLGDRSEPAVPFLIAMLGDDVRLEWETPDADPTNPLDEAKKRILGFYKEKETSPGREAGRALSRLCTTAPQGLIAALKDASAHVRKNAAEALGGIRDTAATLPLTLMLKDEDKEVRGQAARALGRLRDAAATEALIAALKDPDRLVRREVVAALGEIKDPRALPSLLEALQDTVEVRQAAEAALLETRDLRAVEPLIVSLRHRKEDVRRIAARLLGAIGDRRAVRPLILALKDSASDVRFESASALRKLSGEDFGADPAKWQRWHELDQAAKDIEDRLAGDRVHGYIAALHSPDWAARAYAAKALGNLGDRRAAAPLRGVLWDKDPLARQNAATALGQIGDPQAVEPLIAAVSDAEPDVQEAAELALRDITGANFGRDARKWQEWWDENKGTVIARYKARLKEKTEDDTDGRPEEEAPAGAGPKTGTLALLLILVLVAAFPVAILIVLRAMRPR